MSEYIISDRQLGLIQDFATVCIEGEKLARIVRCRDCKYYELQTVVYSTKPLSVCTAEWCEGAERDNPLVESDGFCAWGERRQA